MNSTCLPGSKTPEENVEPTAKRTKVARIPSAKLNDGNSHPLLGSYRSPPPAFHSLDRTHCVLRCNRFGTYKIGYVPPSASNTGDKAGSLPKPTGAETIGVMLSTGVYSLLDCAQFYGN